VVALVLSIVALGVRQLLEPILLGQAPFIVLLAAPILSAWYGGLLPGWAALLICAAGGQMLFVEPRGPDLLGPSDLVKLSLFASIGGLAVWLIATRRSALATLQDEHTQLQRMQEELATRERRIRQTFEASPSGMLLVDRQGRILLVNREAERLFGYPQDELVGKSVDQLVPDYARSGHSGHRESYRNERRRRAMGRGNELQAVRKDGSVFHVQIGLNPLQGESEGLVLASVLDMSEQRAAAEALRHSRTQLQRLFETNLLGIMYWRLDRSVLDANDELLRIWGRPREALGTFTLADLTPDEYRERDERALQHLRQNGRLQPVEKEYLRPDGSRVWVLVGSVMTGEESGISFVLDISKRKTAELALRENEAMFRSLADTIAQLAWMTDASGTVTWYNRRWFDYTGTTPEQMTGQGLRAVHHPDHVDRVFEKYHRHIASGEPWEDTFPLRGKDGQYRWFLSRAFPMTQGGHIVGWFGTNTDVTVQRQAEEALREADRRKDEFIAVLAHELRNPLAPVRNAVEILKRAGVQEPRVARTRDIIDRQVTHMARLIDDLLDVSRIARGKLTLRKELCDVSAIVCQTAEDYRHSLEAAGQQLQLRGCDGPAWVEGDAVRLAQMIGNLLTNAARFNDGPGMVHVQSHIECAVDSPDGRGRVHVVVTDTGIGMDEDLISRLFDPFAQATQDIARSRGGLGLGLALTKGLAELHGGSVVAESDGPSRGSRFTISLPLARAEKPQRPERDTHGPGDTLRILVIEDNQDAAATLGELLQLLGHEVELAYDGRSGIDLAQRMRPDAVISDIGLPGSISGYDVGRALRADTSLDGVYLIALSGYADALARKRCSEAGFDAHLAKPPDIAALEHALGAVQPGGVRAQEEAH
jgi:PAS domain S-box-containing protein